ncbi:MAG: type IV pilin protein [Gammaproteobacteria bacterium]|nr:type IV pilin protein [Gammaproteobacteria bacterium]
MLKECSVYKQRGFTMIEILIVVAIIGIIAAIALPSFSDSRLRAGRADGKTALMQVASDQESLYSSTFTYSTNAVPLASPPVALLASRDGKYEVSVAVCGGGVPITSCFLATAAPQGNQVDDSCGNLTINSTGVRTAAGGTVEECWQR